MFCIVPLQTYLYRKDRLKHGTNRPEARFLTSLVGVWGFPISLLWFAFTDDGYVPTPRPDSAVTHGLLWGGPNDSPNRLLPNPGRQTVLLTR